MNLLQGLRIVTTALNLPGPAACARLRDLGASVAKVEPPEGDPFEQFCPSWYRRLHEGMTIGRLDLKSETGRRAMDKLLDDADLLVTAQRASALARMGLDPKTLAGQHPKLCHVAITGHAPPDDELPGHDLTYLASHGLLSPPELPRTLFADMAGAERAVSTALALVIRRDRSGNAGSATVALADAAAALAQPLHEGLTRAGALLGGGFAGYNVYAARSGWVALAALEPRFEKRLAEKFALGRLTHEGLRALFATHDADYWEEWARKNDLPIVAVRGATNPSG
jgi:crotonobetainyl-CoA:carnitine CoA-transferase CaiB-like acyl-CoA transferase